MSNNNKNYTLMDAKKAEEIVRSNVKKRRRKDDRIAPEVC